MSLYELFYVSLSVTVCVIMINEDCWHTKAGNKASFAIYEKL